MCLPLVNSCELKIISPGCLMIFYLLVNQHCSDDDSMTRPLLLVTASVDKIALKKSISVDIDLKIVGAVIWVGRSSIEIQLEVIQSTKGTYFSNKLYM